jgi:hypothetical protein
LITLKDTRFTASELKTNFNRKKENKNKIYYNDYNMKFSTIEEIKAGFVHRAADFKVDPNFEGDTSP